MKIFTMLLLVISLLASSLSLAVSNDDNLPDAVEVDQCWMKFSVDDVLFGGGPVICLMKSSNLTSYDKNRSKCNLTLINWEKLSNDTFELTVQPQNSANGSISCNPGDSCALDLSHLTKAVVLLEVSRLCNPSVDLSSWNEASFTGSEKPDVGSSTRLVSTTSRTHPHPRKITRRRPTTQMPRSSNSSIGLTTLNSSMPQTHNVTSLEQHGNAVEDVKCSYGSVIGVLPHGVITFSCYLMSSNFKPSGENRSNCNLTSTNFTSSDGNCSICNLTSSNFTSSDGNCSNCNLISTNFTSSDGNCSNCNLTSSNFTSTDGNRSNCNLTSSNFTSSDGNCSNCNLTSTSIDGNRTICNLTSSNFTSSDETRIKCNVSGSNFTSSGKSRPKCNLILTNWVKFSELYLFSVRALNATNDGTLCNSSNSCTLELNPPSNVSVVLLGVSRFCNSLRNLTRMSSTSRAETTSKSVSISTGVSSTESGKPNVESSTPLYDIIRQIVSKITKQPKPQTYNIPPFPKTQRTIWPIGPGTTNSPKPPTYNTKFPEPTRVIPPSRTTSSSKPWVPYPTTAMPYRTTPQIGWITPSSSRPQSTTKRPKKTKS